MPERKKSLAKKCPEAKSQTWKTPMRSLEHVILEVEAELACKMPAPDFTSKGVQCHMKGLGSAADAEIG